MLFHNLVFIFTEFIVIIFPGHYLFFPHIFIATLSSVTAVDTVYLTYIDCWTHSLFLVFYAKINILNYKGFYASLAVSLGRISRSGIN